MSKPIFTMCFIGLLALLSAPLNAGAQSQATTGVIEGYVADVYVQAGPNVIHEMNDGSKIMVDLSRTPDGSPVMGYLIDRIYVRSATGEITELRTQSTPRAEPSCPSGTVYKCWHDYVDNMSICDCVKPSGGGGVDRPLLPFEDGSGDEIYLKPFKADFVITY